MNTLCPLDNVRIILSHTSHPGNIGAAVRAMKTMGLTSLYLVNPKSFPDKAADIRAVGARDILDQVQICTDMDQALDGTMMAAAVTARARGLPHECFDSRQGAQALLDYARMHPVALLFGAETAGLTTAEVSKCQMTIHIPTNPDYSSLNLASAVQVMAYELRMALPAVEQQPHLPRMPAAFKDIELFYQHLEQVMVRTNFLNPEEPKRLMQRMRRLFSRARLEKDEVNILRGILSAAEKQMDK
ncbi:MAG: RNA methyltransferase [Nitrosomonas sp.]|nr:RNA methyltransferase [Nitrosomonas sp.]MDP1950903.1 RNA methyltransferase [Nitrosomonas sp.]